MSTPVSTSLDSFNCKTTLNVGSKPYTYFSLKKAEANGLAGISALPYTLKVLGYQERYRGYCRLAQTRQVFG